MKYTNVAGFCRIWKKISKIHKNTAQKAYWWCCFQLLQKNHFMMKNGFFQKDQLGIGLLVRKCAEIGQKRDFRAFFSEIYMKIDLFSIFEHNYTSAPIAQLAERLTFFIWFWPDQTWPERVPVQFPLEEHDFFSSFKLIFLSILCMHLYHILINWSQKFWVVHVHYRFICEQCAYNNIRVGQDSKFAKFWPRALTMKKLTMLLPLACLKMYFLKVLQRLSEFV